jgi:thiamine biosynthesis lipoprotein
MTGSVTVDNPENESWALDVLWRTIDAVDKAANRFRSDSELSLLNADTSGAPTVVSDTLWSLLVHAQLASDATNDLVSPFTLRALTALGYDRDFDELSAMPQEGPVVTPRAVNGRMVLSPDSRTVQLLDGAQLDLGSTAKALTADWVANELSQRGGCCVEIGGDVAVRPASSPWVIGIANTLSLTGTEPRIGMTSGGVATSSVTSRVWSFNDVVVHHIIDPRTSLPAVTNYAGATVTASSAFLANVYATFALIDPDAAIYEMAQAGSSARLVTHSGAIEYVGAWPQESEVA